MQKGNIRWTCISCAPSSPLPTAAASRLLDGLGDSMFMYFCHSYALSPGLDTAATSHHGLELSAVVERGNVFGVQFHPEKSGDAGLRLLRNFLGTAAGAC